MNEFVKTWLTNYGKRFDEYIQYLPHSEYYMYYKAENSFCQQNFYLALSNFARAQRQQCAEAYTDFVDNYSDDIYHAIENASIPIK